VRTYGLFLEETNALLLEIDTTSGIFMGEHRV
jgi:hypothetical protein